MPRPPFWEELPEKCQRCLRKRGIEPDGEPIYTRKIGRIKGSELREEFQRAYQLCKGNLSEVHKFLAQRWHCTVRHLRRVTGGIKPQVSAHELRKDAACLPSTLGVPRRNSTP